MRTARVALIGTLVLLVAGLGSTMEARKKKDPMHVRDGVLDEIDLRVAAIERSIPVVIRTFPADKAELGTGEEGGKENRVEAAQSMQKLAPDLLKEALKKALAESGVFGALITDDGGTVPEGAVVIEGRFVLIDPGSRAKRYWVSFGAGKSGVGVAGTVKDSAGELLASFKHRKHSGIGVGGGDYIKFMSDDTKDVGKDIARFLTGWATGKDLSDD